MNTIISITVDIVAPGIDLDNCLAAKTPIICLSLAEKEKLKQESLTINCTPATFKDFWCKFKNFRRQGLGHFEDEFKA